MIALLALFLLTVISMGIYVSVMNGKRESRKGYKRFFLWMHHKDIMNKKGELYLSRYELLYLPGMVLMFHKMHLPDQDRCHHDHPWWFITCVLRGGYMEEVTNLAENLKYERWNAPGTVLFRKATHTHRVAELPTGSCWTLLLRGSRKRKWGFRNERGRWLPYDEFLGWAGAVLWCDED